MFKPLSLFIGLRYTASKRDNNFISFISLVSIGGIALGVMAMIVVLSVMTGLKEGIEERTLAIAFHNTLYSKDNYFEDGVWQELREETLQEPNVSASAPFTMGQGLANHDGLMAPISIIGVDPQYEPTLSPIVGKISKQNDEGLALIDGDFDLLEDRSFNVIVGVEMAKNLNLSIGDQLSLVTSDINVTVAGATPRTRRVTVAGFFEIGMYEYDANTLYLHINDANRLFRLPQDSIQGLRLKLHDPMKARETAEGMYSFLQRNDIQMHTWINQFAELFRMIEVEKVVMFIIMSLIVAVAVFNVISMLVMVVTEKQAEIAILRTLGMSPREIMTIFMVQGTVIGFFGTLIGLILGLLLSFNLSDIVAWLEDFLGKTLFEPSVYPVSEIPSVVLLGDVIRVTSVAFILASLATLYPAWRAAKTQPAEALRYD